MYFSYPGVSEATLRKAAGCAPSPCLMLIEGATANSCEPAVLHHIRKSRDLPAGEALEALRDDLGEQIAKHLGRL